MKFGPNNFGLGNQAICRKDEDTKNVHYEDVPELVEQGWEVLIIGNADVRSVEDLTLNWMQTAAMYRPCVGNHPNKRLTYQLQRALKLDSYEERLDALKKIVNDVREKNESDAAALANRYRSGPSV